MNLLNRAPVPLGAPRLPEGGPARSHFLAPVASGIREELKPTQEHLMGQGPAFPLKGKGVLPPRLPSILTHKADCGVRQCF